MTGDGKRPNRLVPASMAVRPSWSTEPHPSHDRRFPLGTFDQPRTLASQSDDGRRAVETRPVTLHFDLRAPEILRRARRAFPAAPGMPDACFRLVGSDTVDAPPTRGTRFARATPPSPLAHGAAERYSIASSPGAAVLRRAIREFDGYLSRRCGVGPFSGDERCLLRRAVIPSPGDCLLADGTRIVAGDPVIDLHLWNEHIPPVPEGGPDLAWGRLVAQRLQHSLGLLCTAVRTDPDLCAAKAIRAKTNFVGWGEQGESLSRLIGRFGFKDVSEGAASIPERVHDAFENVLIGALTWTHNPRALRRGKLVRRRRPVWMSVDVLRRRYAG